MSIRGFLSTKRSSQGISPYMPTTNRLFPSFACLYPHNLRGINNWPQEGNHRSQTVSKDRNIVHEYHLKMLVRLSYEKVFTAYFQGSFKFEKNRLADKDFTSSGNKALDFAFKQVDLFTRLSAFDAKEFLDNFVDIKVRSFRWVHWTWTCKLKKKSTKKLKYTEKIYWHKYDLSSRFIYLFDNIITWYAKYIFNLCENH